MPGTAESNVGSYIGVPIRFSDGRVVGTLCGIDPDPHHFTAAQVAFLQVLAAFMAAALERGIGVAPPTHRPTRLLQVPILPEGPVPPLPPAPPEARRGVAVVFDNTTGGRSPLVTALAAAGYAAYAAPGAYSPARAREVVEAWNPRLVLVAATEPPELSLELVRTLREDLTPRRLWIFFLARAATDSLKAYVAGATYCLPYDSDPASLVAEAQKFK